MGLFDSIAKFVNDKVSEELKNQIGSEQSPVSSGSNNKEVPLMYNEFPKFTGNMTNLYERKTSNYDRCSIEYNNVSEDSMNNYTATIQNLGYNKVTNIRYEKNNTYIIVDYNYGDLNIVYHIKK